MAEKHERAMKRKYEARADDPGRPRKFRTPNSAPPPPTMQGGTYRMVMIRRGGEVKVWYADKAPKTEWLLKRAKKWRAGFVTRYWPSKKAWRLLDLRQAQCFTVFLNRGGSRPTWTGHRFLDTLFPSEDAAVMAAIALSAA